MKTNHYISFFSRTTSGQLKTWSCWIEADGITVTSSWGIKGGKMQTTSDTMTSRGKRGTLAYKPPREVALEEHARQVTKKVRTGYVEAEARAAAVQLEKLKSGLDFNHLPRKFAPAKPIREIEWKEALRLETAGKLMIERKRDGMRHYIVAGTDGTIRVYSRGMDDLTEHFKRFTQELTLPGGSILDAEFVVTTPDGDDNFKAVSEIVRSKAERAKRLMVMYERNGHEIRFMVFDLLFYDRLPTWQLPFSQRYDALLKGLDKAHGKKSRTQFHHVVPMPQLEHSLGVCEKMVRQREWEGLVLWRKDQATQVHMNGSPKRCNCYKFKPMKEGDFIATGYELGKGRLSGMVGALKIAVNMNEGGRRFTRYLGNVGTGFDQATRLAALKWKYPCVIEVKYEKMSATGLRFPSFLRKREDKKPKECVI